MTIETAIGKFCIPKSSVDNPLDAKCRQSPAEARLMCRLASESHRILEIGRRVGGGTVLMALASPDDCQIYSLDIQDKYSKMVEDLFSEHASHVRSKCHLIVADSKKHFKQWNERLDFIFIDGDHLGVESDLRYAKFLNRGGFIAFHDYNANRVKRAVSKFVKKNRPNYAYHSRVKSTQVLRLKYENET